MLVIGTEGLTDNMEYLSSASPNLDCTPTIPVLGLINQGPAPSSQAKKSVEIRPLKPQEEGTVSDFVQWILGDVNAPRLYSFSFLHPLTLVYMVMFGGLLQEWHNSVILSVLLPPLLTLATIHCRVWLMFRKCPSLLKSSDLSHPYQYYSRRRRAFLVAVDDGQVVATVACDVKDSSTAVVKHICVHKDYRSMDVGDRLLNRAIQFCKEQQYQKVALCISSLQTQAYKMFEKNGFKWLRDERYVTLLPGVSVWWHHYVLDMGRLL